MNTLLPAFNRDPAFIHALVRLYPAFIRGPAFIRRRCLIEEIRYMILYYIYIYICIYTYTMHILSTCTDQWNINMYRLTIPCAPF